MSNILQQPKTVFKRKGHGNVFAELAALAHTHPDTPVSELEAALEPASFKEATQEDGACPINLPPIHCPSCRFNPTHLKCEFYPIKDRIR